MQNRGAQVRAEEEQQFVVQVGGADRVLCETKDDEQVRVVQSGRGDLAAFLAQNPTTFLQKFRQGIFLPLQTQKQKTELLH